MIFIGNINWARIGRVLSLKKIYPPSGFTKKYLPAIKFKVV